MDVAYEGISGRPGVEVWTVVVDPDLDTAPGEVIGDLAYVLARVLGASTS